MSGVYFAFVRREFHGSLGIEYVQCKRRSFSVVCYAVEACHFIKNYCQSFHWITASVVVTAL